MSTNIHTAVSHHAERTKEEAQLEVSLKHAALTALLQHPGWKVLEDHLKAQEEAVLAGPVVSGEDSMRRLLSLTAMRELRFLPHSMLHSLGYSMRQP